MSASSIAALKKSRKADMAKWRTRPIEDEFVYIWADGVNVKIRLGEDKKLCLLVLIGVNQDGEKKLIAVEGGYRESTESWKTIFNDLIRRGLKAPLAIVGDGALGLWSAIDKVPEFKETKEMRCWVHKIANVLNLFPKRTQPAVKQKLHDMMMAERKSDAEIVKKEFMQDYGEKYPKAIKCLDKNWSELTAFFDFPATHWQSLRTTNPIESTFATVKLRTRTTKGAGNMEIAETMAFKLMCVAEKRWRKIKGYQKIPGLLKGDLYKDGKLVDIEESRGRIA
ncbi:MAG: IS256 family transposase [Candidatus Electrothrix sp. LOE1_4_5]|nr:IS256 family transposase [Candidatus Electrothrix gigas]